MKLLTIWQNEETGTYTIAVDCMITHECVAADEISAIIDEIMKNN